MNAIQIQQYIDNTTLTDDQFHIAIYTLLMAAVSVADYHTGFPSDDLADLLRRIENSIYVCQCRMGAIPAGCEGDGLSYANDVVKYAAMKQAQSLSKQAVK
jgi:hypothetical protein